MTGDDYRTSALERGRPTDPCECESCECNLHTYPDDTECIWCRSGDHADGGRSG